MRKYFCIVLIAGLVGCSSVKVTKITDQNVGTAKGLRYSLPSRFVVVKPKDDGTVEVKIEHFPDDALTFAVTGKTVLGKNTLNVSVANGQISILAFKPSTADTAAQLATSAGNVRNAELLAEKTAATTATTSRNTLVKEIADATLALEQARAELALAEKALAGQPEKLLAYQAKVTSAELKLAALQSRLGLLDAANDASGVLGDPAGEGRAYGPTFFAIAEDYSDPQNPRVSLVAIRPPVGNGHFRVLDASAAPQPPVTVGPANGCPTVAEMVRIEYSRAEKMIKALHVSNIAVEKIDVSRFDRPDLIVLSVENGVQQPKDGVTANPGETFTVQVTAKVDGKTCHETDNVTIPTE